MECMDKLTGEKQENPNLFKKGESGNPNGRPKGSISVISRLKRDFRENPEEFDSFVKRYRDNPNNEKHVVEMIDNKPMQKTDITSGGERITGINYLPPKEE